ncbi:PadR family transcriptional regulator [Streptomyces sp. AF1A]|uniref:PadR family transcriptional regulator n=1 Tax=Streptomyces sp. AF1A TaxID=3394350 RepID=UPI0039BD24A8
MPLHHAVLALLTQRPSHGYELKARFEEAIGPQWGGLNIGHLYQILERLVRDGYVSRAQVTQADRPDKNLYTLTDAGRTELDTWATTAWVRVGGFRDELFLKLFGAVALGPQALTTLLEAQRQTYLSELAGLAQQRRAHAAEPLVAVLIDAAIAHTKADLALLDSAAQHLAPLAEAHGAQASQRSQPPGHGDADATRGDGGHDGAEGPRAESA